MNDLAAFLVTFVALTVTWFLVDEVKKRLESRRNVELQLLFPSGEVKKVLIDPFASTRENEDVIHQALQANPSPNSLVAF